MNAIVHEILTLAKRVPLTISRGTITHNEVLWLRWRHEDCEGWGEAVPFDVGDYGETLADIVAALDAARRWLSETSPWDRLAIERRLRAERAPTALIAAVDQALLDWAGKRLGLPVWRLLGFSGRPGPLTSVTIGIAPPDAARRRVQLWREAGEVRAFKLKLGSPAGLAADQALFEAVREEIGPGFRLSVDANGGWSVPDACAMSAWLAGRGVDHLEQPLPRGQERGLPEVRRASSLPVFVDESCRDSAELAALASACAIDGANIKLMKCGGLAEALRMIATARAHGLRLLVGCYGSTALGNTAAATLGPLVDYLDLDSQLNLAGDPFTGARLVEGRLDLPDAPGFGVSHQTDTGNVSRTTWIPK